MQKIVTRDFKFSIIHIVLIAKLKIYKKSVFLIAFNTLNLMHRRHFLWLTISLVVTFLCLSINLKNDFLNWDDPAYILYNPLVKDFSFNGIKNIFITKEVVSTYSPLVLLSWSMDYAISGLHPFTFHLFNIIFHLGIVALVFYLSWQLSKRIEVAFIVSILFGIHPMHVEAVSWISARKDLLYTLFFITGLIFYNFYTEKETKYSKTYYYIGCLVVYLLSLLSKGTAVIFPLVLFLFDYLKNRKSIKNILLEKIPFFILSTLFLFIAVDGQSSGGAMEDVTHVSVFDSLSVGFYGYLTYLIKSIIPFNLSVYHPYPNELGVSYPWYFYASAIPVIALFLLTILKAKKHKFLGFGIVFFFITLIPVIQVLPFGSAVTADRYTYLPYFGLFFLFGLGFIKVLDHQKKLRKPITIIAIVYLIVLGGISFQYVKTFRNGETMWSNIIKHYPDDFLAYMNRGNYRITQGQYEKAIEDLDKGIYLNPKYYPLPYNRAMAYKGLEKNKQAIQDYALSISLAPNNSSSFLNRGMIYNDIGDHDKAIADFNKVIQLNPDGYKGYYNRAISHKRKGQYKEAIRDFSKVISLQQIVPLSLYNRGELFLILGQKENAFSDFNTLIRIDPNIANAYTKRGLLYLEAKNYDLAEKDFRVAINLDKTQMDAYINLGVILMNTSRFNDAIKNFNIAQKLNPNHYLVYYNRGLLHQLIGNYTIAIEEFDTALRINPDFTLAKNNKEKTMLLLEEKK